MRTEIALLSLLALAGVSVFFHENAVTVSMGGNQTKYNAWVQWKAQHGQNINESDEEYRFTVFSSNFDLINKINSEESSFQLAINEFAHLTNSEFNALKTTKLSKSETNEHEVTQVTNSALPASVDWLAKGAVTSVKNQGVCGSCWAFSTVAGLEGIYAINGNPLTNFSEQQVTSCVPAPFSDGCNGGEPYYAYLYAVKQGIETAANYPYVQQNNADTASCKYSKSQAIQNVNKGVGRVPANNPTALQTQLVSQPVSVSVDAGNIYFQFYNSGVLNSSKCGTELDHAITATGYNTTSTTPYWNVKNSWGNTWGENGYIRIAITSGDGVCGINMDNTYPTGLN